MPFFVQDQADVLSFLYPTNFSEYELMLRSLGDMLEREILPLAEKIDKEKIFPRENLRKLFDLDVTAMSFPEKYGGLELPAPGYAAAIELVGKACASTAISIAIHGTVCQGIALFGSEEQKENYLEPLLKGKKLGSFALTEPSSGSDRVKPFYPRAQSFLSLFSCQGSQATSFKQQATIRESLLLVACDLLLDGGH
jgi:butyryl-CoA dehydrogenase